jgi:phage terminase Nu1 subunit (DNA packaging protein)
MPNPILMVELTKVADSVFGIGWRRYRQLASDGVVPPVGGGKIDFVEASKKLIEYYRKRAETGGSLSLTDERTRLTRINADRKELELEKMRGDTIDTEKAQQAWAAVMQNIVNKLEIIPSKLPPLACGLTIPEIKAVVEKMLYEVRNEIANPDLKDIARMASGKRASKHGPPKAAPHGVRVGRRKQDIKPRGKRGARKVVHVEG